MTDLNGLWRSPAGEPGRLLIRVTSWRLQQDVKDRRVYLEGEVLEGDVLDKLHILEPIMPSRPLVLYLQNLGVDSLNAEEKQCIRVEGLLKTKSEVDSEIKASEAQMKAMLKSMEGVAKSMAIPSSMMPDIVDGDKKTFTGLAERFRKVWKR